MPNPKKRRLSSSTNGQTHKIRRLTRINLCDLPNELLLEIIGHLVDPLNRREFQWAILQFSLVNHLLHGLASRYVYHTIDTRICSVRKLTAKLVDNPDLASEVRHLAFSKVTDNRGKKPPRRHEGQRALRRKVHEFKLRDERFSRMPDYHDKGDKLAILLLLVPKLETLDVTLVDQYPSHHHRFYGIPSWLGLLEAAGLNESPKINQHFQHLHTMRIAVGSLEFSPLYHALKIRSLRTLMIQKSDDGIVLPIQLIRDEPCECLVENVYLWDGWVQLDAVAYFLSLFKSLRVFVHEYNAGINTMYSEPSDDRLLMKAILAHQNSLEQLSISRLPTNITAASHAPLENSTLYSLSLLHKLRVLEVGTILNPGPLRLSDLTLHAAKNQWPAYVATNLPASLTHLYVRLEWRYQEIQDEAFFYGYYEDLAYRCQQRAPGLKEIIVTPPDFCTMGWVSPFIAACGVRIRSDRASLKLSNERWEWSIDRYLSRERELRNLLTPAITADSTWL